MGKRGGRFDRGAREFRMRRNRLTGEAPRQTQGHGGAEGKGGKARHRPNEDLARKAGAIVQNRIAALIDPIAHTPNPAN